MPAEQRGCMKMSETVLEDQGVDLHVFQEITITKWTYMKYLLDYQIIDSHALQEYTKSSCLLECRARFQLAHFHRLQPHFPNSFFHGWIYFRAMLEKCGCIVYYYPTLPEEFVRETLPEVAAAKIKHQH